ncbi:MAG: UTP--glucose-1-phosphate uridylyltransferase [Candidatus Puniceispirillum sp.]|nr:UTP--glucose-1-phosphate uridylyltransferase [Candidatus Pelagibacter sp.]MBA4283198.1 UTP--glucose-1-phosphate uridylyltransferase [Candidatus Puniceispirillum sp.]
MIKTCVFPVAGLGSRFLPATKSIPKEMLVVVDKPLIQYAVEEAKAAGIERFIFVTSQGKSAIEDHFDRLPLLEQTLEKRKKINLLSKIIETALPPSQAIYVRQPFPLGLGHAILCAQHLIQEEAFAVILADDIILSQKSCMKQMIESYRPGDGNMVATMMVEPEHVSRYGILTVESEEDKKVRASAVVEKPTLEDAPSRFAVIGRYILKKSIFGFLDRQNPGAGSEIQLTDSIQKMIPETALTGFSFDGERYDCGTKEGWLEANIAFACQDENMLSYLGPMLRRYALAHDF